VAMADAARPLTVRDGPKAAGRTVRSDAGPYLYSADNRHLVARPLPALQVLTTRNTQADKLMVLGFTTTETAIIPPLPKDLLARTRSVLTADSISIRMFIIAPSDSSILGA
jgi:hypothetical protein